MIPRSKTHPRWRSVCLVVPGLIAAGLALTSAMSGCKSKEKPPEIAQVETAPNPMPRFLRGTVVYEANLRGYAPMLVEGYGIVVGLDGTGSADTPIAVRAILEKQGSRLLSGTEIGSGRPLTMQRLLADPNTAAVLVQAAIPPGAVKGTTFDLLVTAVRGSSTTSLEGGRLWTTEMRPGLADREIGGTTPIASGAGDLFINPFRSNLSPLRSSLSERWNDPERAQTRSADEVVDDPGFEPIKDSNNRRMARVLGGGRVLKDLGLSLHLRNTDFSRARALLDAVNTRFPQEPGQARLTATPVSGRSGEEIAIIVPPSWADRTERFVEILMHTQIYPGGVQLRSLQLSRWVIENPIDAADVTWCWVALGNLAIDGFADLYEYPDLVPRLAALHAGAQLGDARVIGPLLEIASDRSNALRVVAIRRLAEMPRSARINLAMRDFVDDPELDVRVAAVDALLDSGDPYVRRASVDLNPAFDVYSLPATKPLVYVTIQGRPRIIVFGEDSRLPCPMSATTLDDRLMLQWQDSAERFKVRYRPKGTLSGRVYEPSPSVVGFLRFLGTRPSPRSSTASLGMTYGEVLRVLHEMQLQNVLGSTLVPENNALTASIIEGQRRIVPDERPETRNKKDQWDKFETTGDAGKAPGRKPESVGMDKTSVRDR